MADLQGMMDEGRRNRAMETILQREVATPLNAAAAAALTVAAAILKSGHENRNETVSEAVLKEEVQKLFWEMRGLTDVNIGLAQRQRAAQKRQEKP